MRWREYPVLSEDDRLVTAFGAMLPDDAAHVLAYLATRRDHDDIDPPETTRLAIRVGTDLGREPVSNALSTLEDRDLVTTTTVETDARGRPPKGWTTAEPRDTLDWRLRRRHAEALLGRAATVATHFGATLPPTFADDVTLPEEHVSEEDPLAVALNWVPNGLHAPLVAAADTDSYRDHGLSVTLDPARGSGASLARLDDDADVAVVGAASLCRAERDDLVPLALLHQRSLAVLYTTEARLDGPFDSVERLRGRRLAVTPDSEVGLLARLFLAQTGILSDVEVVETRGEERAALADGRVDVATGMPVDPHELATDGHDVSAIAVADHFPVPGPALVTTVRTATERPAALGRFLMGTTAGVVATLLHPGETAAQVADRSDDPAETERWRIDRAYHTDGSTPSDGGWGLQSTDLWERIQVALRQEAADSPSRGC